MEKNLKPISKLCTKKILDQMDNSIYKVKDKNGYFKIAFFCKIKYENKNIPILILNNHILKESNTNFIELYNNNKKIKFEFENLLYNNNQYDIAIIDIKEKMIEKINFLQMDDRLYEENFEMLYPKENIYIIHFDKKEKDLFVSYGTLNNINNLDYYHSCNIESNIGIYPIFNIDNNKIIGIYKKDSLYSNKGISLKYIIDKVIKQLKLKKFENEIDLEVEVEDYEKNEKIYFLNNSEYKNSYDIPIYKDSLNELNLFNTKLYINNKKYKFEKYFIPVKSDIYYIKIKFNTFLTDCSFMFAGCNNIKNINFSRFNSKYIEKMEYMFADCHNLENINLLSFNTKRTNDMNHLFYKCKNLTNIDLSSFDTRNVKDMSYMFHSCKDLKMINLLQFDTKNVINLSHLFYKCEKLESINLSSFDTKNITDMSSMFYGCTNLSCIDLSNFNTNKVIDINSMFKKCWHLINLNISSFNFKNVINLSDLFFGCGNLVDIDLSNFETDNLENMSNMFYNCSKIKKLDLSNFDTNHVTNMSGMFYGCKELTNLNLFYPGIDSEKNFANIFYDYLGYKNDNLSKFNTKNVEDMSGLFHGCENLREIDLSKFNTEKVKDISGLFYDCKKLEEIDLSLFDTRNVINMSELFYGCENLANIDLSHLDTKKVINIRGIFQGCKKLENIDLSNFDSKKFADMRYMFHGCKSLTNPNLISFMNQKFNEISNIFFNCGIFKDIDFSLFSEDTINYSCEFVIKVISKIKNNDNKNYTINKIKSLKFLNKEGDIIKFKNKIIVMNDNKQYILNFVIDDDNADFTFIEYDINDIESLQGIENNLNINEINNVNLIGIKFNEDDKIKNEEIIENLYGIKHYYISSNNDNDIKSLFNKLLNNIENNKISYKDKNKDRYKIIFFPCSFYLDGKSSIIKRIIDNTFSDSIYSTVSTDICLKKIRLKSGKEIIMQLCDFLGGGRFRNMAFNELKTSDCVILVFDVSNKKSFDQLKDVIGYSKDKFKNQKLIYLIGNKIDLVLNGEKEREVSKEDALKLAKEYNLKYFETSCKNDIGIKEFTIDLINEIIKIKKEKIKK